MKRCIDCLKKFDCGKANPDEICNKFEKVAGTYTRLEEKDGDIYKFVKMGGTYEEK